MEALRLLQRIFHLPLPPFLLDEWVYDSMGAVPRLDGLAARPLPTWTEAKKQRNGETMPQTIAHRGYKAEFPENTMGAFQGAVGVGADAIETDTHLTQDDVVVLSHDPDLRRCFGRDEKIINCNWHEIKDLQTLKTPHQTMPRLLDLLQFLASDGQENIWLLLDIKLDNDAEKVIRLIADTIHSVPPHPAVPWHSRIVLGCWATKFVPHCIRYLPEFSISHIGFSTTYARRFLRIPNVSFNLILPALMMPILGARFIRDARRQGRPIYAWTVNDDDKMRWCIRKGLDGVITDDPKRFREVCDDWTQGQREVHIPFKQRLGLVYLQIMILIFCVLFWLRFVRRDLREEPPDMRELETPKAEEKVLRRGSKVALAA